LSDFKSFEVAGWTTEGKALRYDALAGRVTRAVVEPLLDALDVQAGERFLDVATGPGNLAAAAATRGARAVGVDVSLDMLALARERYADVAFVEGDAEQLPFANDAFDAAAAAFVLHHVPQPCRVTAELLRVAPRAAVATWAPSEEQPLFASFGAAFDDAGATAADLRRGPRAKSWDAKTSSRRCFPARAFSRSASSTSSRTLVRSSTASSKEASTPPRASPRSRPTSKRACATGSPAASTRTVAARRSCCRCP